ncbi:MAG TPA: hypothetical protein VFZ25_13960 [Chloroflexota bacterium]|nr:hypothetical protein [Chloroflexota bacterium]
MNNFTRVLAFRVGIVASLVALLTLANRLRTDPTWRAGLAWAIRTWITPPDADAGWQQNRSGASAWRGRQS